MQTEVTTADVIDELMTDYTAEKLDLTTRVNLQMNTTEVRLTTMINMLMNTTEVFGEMQAVITMPDTHQVLDVVTMTQLDGMQAVTAMTDTNQVLVVVTMAQLEMDAQPGL